MARLIRYAAISMFGLLTPIVSSAYTYKGKVVDETGSPLIGATVKSADNGLMTTTDANGEFSLEVEKTQPNSRFHTSGSSRRHSS